LRLVHLSDLHLGFRQYQRLTPNGINQREADVARSFEWVVSRVIDLAPEVVVIAGDVFHNVRPTNPAILHAFNQFVRLTRALPDSHVVMVAGNHDVPRSTETGSILKLFQSVGVHVVDREAQRLSFPERDLSILAIPDIHPRPALSVDEAARYNVLVMHGNVPGIVPEYVGIVDRAAVEVSLAELDPSRWTYVALGHYHVFTEVAPNAFYSGSVDYTSVNTWGERWEEEKARVGGKRFIEFDLDLGRATFHRIPSSRPLIDLEPIWARGLTVSELDARIRTAVDACAGGIDDKIVRLVVRDLPRHIGRELDHKALRDYKRRALHFHLDSRRPEVVRSIGSGTAGRRPSLAELVRDKLQSRIIEADIDRTALVELGLQYLRDAETASPAPAVDVEG